MAAADRRTAGPRTASDRPLAIEQSASDAVALFDAIHSVDRASLADALGKEIEKQSRHPVLFVEINTGAEPQKAGVLPQDADAFLAACRDRYGLEISGLMCIPPHDEAPAPHFALTAKIARRNGLKLLSMGMSADFRTAIAFGATHVRVGSAIFGSRPHCRHLVVNLNSGLWRQCARAASAGRPAAARRSPRSGQRRHGRRE